MNRYAFFSSYVTPFKVHSLFFQTMAYAAGIITQASLLSSWVAITSMGITLIITSFYLLGRQNIFLTFGLLGLFFSAGSYRYYYQQEEHLNFHQSILNIPFNAIGTVTSISWIDQSRMRWCVTIQTESIEIETAITPTKKTMQFYVQQKPNLQVQDLIKIQDILVKKVAKPSYNNYLIKEDIAATFFVTSLNYTLLNRPQKSFKRWLFYTKERLMWRFKSKLSPQTFAFFSSVFLGHRSWGKAKMENPKDNCRTWGISHYLARSGLHMVIFIFAWHMLLNTLPLSLLFKDLFLIFLSIIYYLLSWSSISFIRAFTSFILYKFCNILKVQSQLLHLLTIVTLSVLIINPMQLFFLDFQLSFGLTFALAWFNNIHTKKSSPKS
ncbi:MAG: ComEC/Rec2 family competence protein [Candidatus Babeliales bacterium]|nr:ComEC/Rec2 family competence protein [Candidatus Babeliales bacterium]